MTEASQADWDELAEKAPYWTSDVVNARLAHAFIGQERAAAAVLIAGLVGDDPQDPEHSDEASCRLMLDALKLSQGNLLKLRLWMEAARHDPRDLIAAAEYPRELGEKDKGARQTDLDDYIGWLRNG